MMSKSGKNPDEYVYEYGWAFTIKNFRGKGINNFLLRELLRNEKNSNVFATSRADNEPMHHILKKNGFCRVGTGYGESGETELFLFVRRE